MRDFEPKSEEQKSEFPALFQSGSNWHYNLMLLSTVHFTLKIGVQISNKKGENKFKKQNKLWQTCKTQQI